VASANARRLSLQVAAFSYSREVNNWRMLAVEHEQDPGASMKKLSIRGLAAFAVASAFICAPVFAKDHGEGKGHDKHEEKAEKHGGRHEEVRPGAYFSDEHRQFAHRYYEEHYARAGKCPPGLAKKHNGCMPPGQARKWTVGEPLPRNVVYYSVPQPVLVQMPPAPYGYRYTRVGPDIVLVRINGNVVIDVMLNVFN
jgi:Ni/Co efflux regulator RcnB